MPNGDSTRLTVGLPVTKRAMRRRQKGSLANFRLCLSTLNRRLPVFTVVTMAIAERMCMRHHAERTKKHVQQGHKGGLRAGRYEVGYQAQAQNYLS